MKHSKLKLIVLCISMSILIIASANVISVESANSVTNRKNDQLQVQSSTVDNPTNQVSPDTQYSSTIAWGGYYTINFLSNLDKRHYVDWSFSGSSSFVGITVYAMTDYQYLNFYSQGYTAITYLLSDGSKYIHSGSFAVPFLDIWYFVFANRDPDRMSSFVTMNIASRKASASIWSLSSNRLDTDSDGYFDSVQAKIDPNLPSGREGSVTVKLYLKRDLTVGTDPIIKTITKTYSLIGTTATIYTINMGSVTVIDNYYIEARVYHSSTIVQDAYRKTANFALAAAGYGYPFFYSFTQDPYDSNSDGVDDSVRAKFDPDFNIGVPSTGTLAVTVKAYLKTGSTTVSIKTGTFSLSGNAKLTYLLDFGKVANDGTYFIFGELLFNGIVKDTSVTTNFYLRSSTLPNAPIGLTATAGNGQVALSWSSGGDGGSTITSYKIYRGGTFLITISGGVTTHTDTGLTNGQSYSYTVSAVNANGEGPKSISKSATPTAAPISSSTPAPGTTSTPAPGTTSTPDPGSTSTPIDDTTTKESPSITVPEPFPLVSFLLGMISLIGVININRIKRK